MNKLVKMMLAGVATAGYFLILRYVAPSQEPYFIMGIALIGFMAWLYGIVAGLLAALLLIPITHYIYGQFSISTSYLAFASSPAYIALEVLAAVMLGRLRQTNLMLSQKEAFLAEANESLQTALSQVRELGGIHCLCSCCKKILSDDENWMPIDTYLMERTKMEFSHGICPDCGAKYGMTPPDPSVRKTEEPGQ
ncbi:MAG: hypothetical protein KAU94_04120 [Verrucomicrobia bacterium]|nr:hypothetical protein [Verrucomicrobiota bacterium]